jgi:DNA repair protein RadC
MVLELGDEGAELLVVFLRGTAKDNDVVYIGKAELQAFKDLIHETLERLGGAS